MTTAAPTRMLVAGAALVLAACVHVPPADLSRDPAALLEQVRAAQARVERVRGTARVRIDAPGASGSVTEFIAAEKPDRVHLETLDFFGNPAAVLVAGGGRFAFLDQRANVFYRGDATPENVSRLLPFLLPVEELVTILCGSAPLVAGTPLEVQPRGSVLLLTIGQGDLGQRLAIGDEATVESSRVRVSERGPDGRWRETAPAYDLELARFRHRAGIRFPSEVHLDAPAARARVDLVWRDDPDVNEALDARLFHLDPPRGARIVDLPAGASVPAFDLPLEPPRE